MISDSAYNSAVDYIHSLGESVWKLGLDRFRALCERLGNPQDRLKIVHVAGTNGKGSTAAMIAAILHEAGYRTGEYGSPFVYDIRERFRLDGEMMPREALVRLVDEIRPHAEALAGTTHGHPTEFEMKTAIALLWFAQEKADFAVLEVGLGGRLDATNIVTPLVSVITNVTLDHMDRLGTTIPEIAGEKAGIIKEGVQVVTAAQLPEAMEVIRRTCRERHALLWHVRPVGESRRHFEVVAVTSVAESSSTDADRCEIPDGHAFRYDGITAGYETLEVAMRGDFQLLNGATAVASVEALQAQGVAVPEKAIREGLRSAYLPGRLEIVHSCPCVVVDGAHNRDAARLLAHEIQCHFTYDRLILILGMVSGHSIEDVVSALAPLASKVIATSPENRRAASAISVARAARRYCPDVKSVKSVRDAVRTALKAAAPTDLICITGSFYTVGEVPRDMASLTDEV